MGNQEPVELVIEAGRTEGHYWKDLWRYRELFYFLAWRDVVLQAMAVYQYCRASAKILPKLLGDIKKPCLFWLDGHYSGAIMAKGPIETPVVQELLGFLRYCVDGCVMLVDDARDFNGERD